VAYCTIEELAAAIGRGSSFATDNSEALQACVDAAAAEIDHDLDRIDPMPADDPLANRVNIARATEWWKANDALFGVIGFDQTGALQAPRDGFTRHAWVLTPLKQRWGIA